MTILARVHAALAALVLGTHALRAGLTGLALEAMRRPAARRQGA